MNREATSIEHPGVLGVPAPGAVAGGKAIAGGLWQVFKDLVKRPFYSLYLRRLRAKSHSWKHPHHLGIIMDGNRRFARQAGFASALAGHRLGAEKLHDVLRWCHEADVRVVTVWCFSLDNFNRMSAEVKLLLELFETKTREIVTHHSVHDNRVRVRFIGELERLPESLREAIREAEAATAHYRDFVLNIAMAYGGREEITGAFRSHLQSRLEAGETLEEVVAGLDSSAVEPHLYTSGLPEPDLLLRTSGEERLSGFLLWQSAYSELYFCDTNWPSFRKIDFLRAVRSFSQRQRRYGR